MRSSSSDSVVGENWSVLCRGSAERKRISLHPRIEKLDLELSINNGLRLSDQLIQPLFGNRAVALVVNVAPVSSARRPSIDEHAKSHGGSSRCRSHDEMVAAEGEALEAEVRHHLDLIECHRPLRVGLVVGGGLRLGGVTVCAQVCGDYREAFGEARGEEVPH